MGRKQTWACFIQPGVVYHSENGQRSVCRPEAGKTRRVKFFCYICHRYVLPDGKKHWFMLGATPAPPGGSCCKMERK